MKNKIYNFKYKKYLLGFVHKFNTSYICFETPINRYFIIFRNSPNVNIKGKFTLKFLKTINDHIYCGC